MLRCPLSCSGIKSFNSDNSRSIEKCHAGSCVLSVCSNLAVLHSCYQPVAGKGVTHHVCVVLLLCVAGQSRPAYPDHAVCRVGACPVGGCADTQQQREHRTRHSQPVAQPGGSPMPSYDSLLGQKLSASSYCQDVAGMQCCTQFMSTSSQVCSM